MLGEMVNCSLYPLSLSFSPYHDDTMYRSLCSWESEWSGLFLIVSLLVFAILIMGLSIHYFLLGVRFLQWRARYWFWCRCPKMNKTFIYSYISVGTRVSVCVRESPCSLSLLFSPSIERTLPASNPCFMSHLTSLSPSPLHTELYLGSNSKSNRSPLFSSSIAHSTTNSSLIKSHTQSNFSTHLQNRWKIILQTQKSKSAKKTGYRLPIRPSFVRGSWSARSVASIEQAPFFFIMIKPSLYNQKYNY